MKKIISLTVALLMIFSMTTYINATEDDSSGDTNVSNLETTTNSNGETVVEVPFYDDNGNLYYEEVGDGSVDEGIASARSDAFSSGSILVNFNYNISSSITTSYTNTVSGASGYLHGQANADAVYLGTENGKVKFMQSGVIGLVDASKVQLVSALKYYESYYIYEGSGFYHYICTDVNNAPASKILISNSKPAYITAGTKYYSYDGHYFYTNYDTMTTNYKSNNRNNAVNKSSPFYNYFQYLSMRSTTSYSASQLNSYITKVKGTTTQMSNSGSSFINYQNKYGVNALLSFAVACNESAYGTSNISKTKNNLFGLSVYDSNTGAGTTYNSVDSCIKDFMERWMSTGYLDTSDWRYNGANLGDKGGGCNVQYASGSTWGETAASIALRIDNYLGGNEKSKYTIAISDTLNSGYSNVSITSSPGGSNLYSQGKHPNYPVIVIGSSGNYYKIQSDSVLNSAGTAIDKTGTSYNYSKDVGYVSKNTFTIAYSGTYTESTTPTLTYQGYTAGSWLTSVQAGEIAGTTGQSKKLEAFKINLDTGSYGGGINYQAHVSNVGWQTARSSGQTAGIEGSNQIEAIKISLTGNISNYYDIYYRVHTSKIGWLGWTKNGASAGTTSFGLSAEAIEVKLVSKGASAPGSTDNSYYSNDINYSTHVSGIGWQSNVSNGTTAGTTGQSKAVEAFKVSMNSYYKGNVVYKAHVQNVGWQSETSNGNVAGTTGKSLRVEAFTINLTDELEENYDVYYRAYVQNYGWLDWSSNGAKAGTVGYGYRVEAMQVKIVNKGAAAPGATTNPFKVSKITYSTHVQTIGWQSSAVEGQTSGTTGKSYRLEGIKINLSNLSEINEAGGISYSTHVQNYGWQNYVSNGALSGTTGKSLRLEAIKIKLTGDIANDYDVYYRVHAQNYGWMGWTKNNEMAGTSGYGYRLEAIEIQVVKKGETSPGNTSNSYKIK
ncbi:MAG: glucosaminidase domain-containing protein [Thomasclavelia sp.]|jgi:uncharacterized protein YjdB|nr:glucosaminidase domain-containing protein [Thomasclavelia sp.]